MPDSTKTISIKGMHCRSCEILVEESLLQIPGVTQAKVSEKKGTAEVLYSGEISDDTFENAVTSCGYTIGKDNKSWFSKDLNVYYDLMKATLVFVILYFVAKNFGLFKLAANTSNNLSSIPVVFLVGLTAGVSTCMALVGGLVLSVSAKYAESHPHATPQQKFMPHIIFNAGRIIFFTLLGGLIGYFGSLLQLGSASIGTLTILVGMVMLLMGLQIIGVFPKLEQIRFTLPKEIYKLLRIDAKKQENYRNSGPFLLGGLSFFVPCGFTQAMQLYAVSSGSVTTGAITMGVFALGTSPGLLGIGGLTAVIKGRIADTFFKFVGLTVVSLAVFNISNGLNLTGINIPSMPKISAPKTTPIPENKNVSIENGFQVINMTQSAYGYTPKSFTIKKDIPVKWVINSTDSNTCASSIFSSQLGIRKSLKAGENVITFTPTTLGTIKFSCSMGMYTGYFTVVDSI
ncbi:hypothetical protein GYA27_03735 [candidate division WWE3 bacterium]|uniref:HMA domain-containing protein n=1 Tax=candidate division WWE3 bacterium TaxID=2053526 RepID=A0A7X9HI64_UNCKA|nr:hypothetical protein [candidate division WWE3 bacterium]